MTDKYNIRAIEIAEYPVLKEFIYLAIFQADKNIPIPRTIIKQADISNYINDFGKKKDDHCLVTELNGEIIAAVWVRLLNGELKGYGYIDDETPEFAISVVEKHRRKGLGEEMMREMIKLLQKKGYKQCSLAVQKANYAAKLYLKLGFETVKETKEEYIMVLKL